MTTKAFTLIELLIVVAIIGILAAIAVPNFLNARMRAKVSRVQADLRSVRTAMGMYMVDYNQPIPDPNVWSMSGFSQPLGYVVYSPLTTPTQYIAGSAFIDPFIPIQNPTSSGAGQFTLEEGPYHYRNVKHLRGQGTSNIPPGPTYLVRSPGPDRWYHGNPFRFLTAMAYAPSNGLVSTGDIIASDAGILGEGFRGVEGNP